MTHALIYMERAAGGWRDRFRAYEVIVNGDKHSDLRRGSATTIEVEPGEVEIYVKIDWCRSRIVRISLDAGEEVRLLCRPGRWWAAFYGVTLGRNDYVRLEEA